MKIHTTEALMKAEISRRSLMKTSALGSLALASSAFTLKSPRTFKRTHDRHRSTL